MALPDSRAVGSGAGSPGILGSYFLRKGRPCSGLSRGNAVAHVIATRQKDSLSCLAESLIIFFPITIRGPDLGCGVREQVPTS